MLSRVPPRERRDGPDPRVVGGGRLPALMAGQRGQALVGVMVVMVILFALAGAVAIGASTLLTNRGSSFSVSDDFRLHSAVNDSVAQLAGSTSTCWAAPAPSPRPSPTSSPMPTPLDLRLPPPDGTSQARCVRMDGVAIGAVQRIAVPPASGQSCASSFDLPFKGPVRVAVVFDVHVNAVPNIGPNTPPWGWAYLVPADFQQVLGCPSGPPNTIFSPCETTIPAFSTATWFQVALTCDIASTQYVQLRIKGSTSSPRQVFAAPQDPHASSLGSFYLLAIQSPVAGAAMEEALLFVSNDGKTNRLQYEAPLLP